MPKGELKCETKSIGDHPKPSPEHKLFERAPTILWGSDIYKLYGRRLKI